MTEREGASALSPGPRVNPFVPGAGSAGASRLGGGREGAVEAPSRWLT
jgi:hypothetical protein